MMAFGPAVNHLSKIARWFWEYENNPLFEEEAMDIRYNYSYTLFIFLRDLAASRGFFFAFDDATKYGTIYLSHYRLKRFSEDTTPTVRDEYYLILEAFFDFHFLVHSFTQPLFFGNMVFVRLLPDTYLGHFQEYYDDRWGSLISLEFRKMLRDPKLPLCHYELIFTELD